MLASSPCEAYRARRNTFFGKGLAAVLLVAVLALSCFAVLDDSDISSAEPETSGECGKDGDNITWSFDTGTGTLTLTGTGEMKNFTSSETKWGGNSIAAVEISEGITSIGNFAFYRTTITSVGIPDSVTAFGDYAFNECSQLTSVTIGKGLDSFGSSFCASCPLLASISVDADNQSLCSENNVLYTKDKDTILRYAPAQPGTAYDFPITVTSIHTSAFSDCSNLTGIVIPDRITSIANQAFRGCTSLQSVTLPADLTKLNQSVFQGCTSLTSITFGSSLNYLDYYAFSGCTSLQSVTLPNTQMYIERYAFSGCTSLQSVTLPSNLKTLRGFVFQGCTSLQSIALPANVTMLADNLFEGCTSLETVTAASPITSLYGNVFKDCSKLTTFDTTSLGTVGPNAFEGCAMLERIVLSDEAGTINKEAFKGCTSLSYVYLGKSLTTVGTDIFSETLYDVDGTSTLEATADNLNGSTFIREDSKLVKLPSGECGANGNNLIWTLFPSTGKLVISGKGNMVNFSPAPGFGPAWQDDVVTAVIEDGVTSIGGHAFNNCDNLTSVTIGKDVSYISYMSLSSSDALESITVSPYNESFKTVDGVLFNKSLTTLIQYPSAKDGTSFTIPNGVTEVSKGAFYQCTKLTSIICPDTLTVVGSQAFQGCSSLESIQLFDKITAINTYTFESCTSLRGVLLSDEVTSIGDFAFKNCVGLQMIYFGAGLTSISNNAFQGNTFYDTDGTTELSVSAGNMNGFAFVRSGDKMVKTDGSPCGPTALWTFDDSTDTLTIMGTGEMTDYSKSTQPWASFREDIRSVIVSDGITTIGNSAFDGCLNLVTVSLPETLTSIGTYAFACTGLKSLSLPSQVTVIKDASFKQCESLTILVIPSTVTAIESFGFNSCTSLTSLYIPDSVTTIGSSAFYNCPNLEFVYFSSGLTSVTSNVVTQSLYTTDGSDEITKDAAGIKGNAFVLAGDKMVQAVPVSAGDDVKYVNNGSGKVTIFGTGAMKDFVNYCTNDRWGGAVNTVTVLPGVTTVGAYAFSKCQDLSSVNLPSTVSAIKTRAFMECSALEDIELPDYVLFGDMAFAYSGLKTLTLPDHVTVTYGILYRSDSLTEIIVSPTSEYNSSDNGVLFSKDMSELILYPFGKTDKSYVIPSNVTTIKNGAFYGSKIEQITIPNGVTCIERLAFCQSKITSVILPDSLTTMKDSVFHSCSDLRSAVLSAGITSVPVSTFSSCAALETVSMPSSLQGIEYGAFSGCESLATAEMPDGVQTLGEYAFYNCSSLTAIVIPDSVQTIDAYSFSLCTGLKKIAFGTGLTTVNSSACGTIVLYDEDGTTVIAVNADNLKGKVFLKVGDKMKLPSTDIDTEGSTASKESATSTASFSDDDLAVVKDMATTDANTTLRVSLSDGKAASFDSAAIAALGDSATNLSIADVDKSTLTDEEKALVGDNPVFDIDFGANTSFGDGKATFTVPFTLPDGKSASNMRVYHIADGKIQETKNCTYADGKVTFDTNHLSMYMIGFESPSGSSGEFPILIVAVIAVVAVAGVGAFFFISKKKQA